MVDTRLYLGRLGALAAIRSPRGTVETTRVRRTSAFGLGIGGAAIDQMVGGARTYTINYEQLTRDDFATIQAFLDGHEGPGPFALLDPAQRNMLPANISGATSVTNTPAAGPAGGFTLSGGIADTFNRAPVASGWGTSTSGAVWATAPSANHTATGTVGTQSLGSVNAFRSAVIDSGSTDFDITVDVSISATPTGASITRWICGRYLDGNNHYIARLDTSTGGTVSLVLLYRSGGSLSGALGTGSVTVGTGAQAGDVWRVRFTGVGTSLAARAWLRDSATEPTAAQTTATDSTLTTGTNVALLSRLETGNTNTLPVTVTWDNLTAAVAWGALTSSTAYTDAGPRVLALTFSATSTVTTAIAPLWPSSTFTYGVPVVSGRALCFSCYVRGGGGDPIATYTPSIIWRDATGTSVGTATAGSGAVASSSGAWAQLYAQGTPAAGAIYADFQVAYTSGASAGTIGYFRRFLLNEGTTPDTVWTPGTGVWPVRFLSMTDAWPFTSPDLRAAPAAVLTEDVS